MAQHKQRNRAVQEQSSLQQVETTTAACVGSEETADNGGAGQTETNINNHMKQLLSNYDR